VAPRPKPALNAPGSAPNPTAFRPARSLKAFRLLTSISAATTVLGVVSTKILATFGGHEAMALVSVFRNIGVLVSRVLMVGADSLAIQQLAAATSDDERRRVVRGTRKMFGIQAGIVALLALGLLVLPRDFAIHEVVLARHIPALWTSLLMALIGMALQLVVSILNAVGDIRRAGAALLVAATTTVVMIYPLLRLGEVGLAMTVGAGAVVGVALGVRLLVRHHPALFGPVAPRTSSSVRLANFSLPMTLQPLITTSGALYGQGAVAGAYAVTGLGAFAAAAMLIDTAAYVLMSGARNHVLPTLARARSRHDKTTFLTYSFTYFCIVATLASVGLIVGAPVAARVLFGARFASSSAIIAAMAVCLPAQAMSYTAAAVLSSSRRFWLCVVGDISSTSAFVAATMACVYSGADLEYMGAAYAVGHISGAIAYLLLVAFGDDTVKLEWRPLVIAPGCTLASVAVLLATRRSLPLGITLGALVVLLLGRQVLSLRAGRSTTASNEPARRS
jgi:O-antigen/teichoic acid export membrane protein